MFRKVQLFLQSSHLTFESTPAMRRSAAGKFKQHRGFPMIFSSSSGLLLNDQQQRRSLSAFATFQQQIQANTERRQELEALPPARRRGKISLWYADLSPEQKKELALLGGRSSTSLHPAAATAGDETGEVENDGGGISEANGDTTTALPRQPANLNKRNRREQQQRANNTNTRKRRGSSFDDGTTATDDIHKISSLKEGGVARHAIRVARAVNKLYTLKLAEEMAEIKKRVAEADVQQDDVGLLHGSVAVAGGDGPPPLDDHHYSNCSQGEEPKRNDSQDNDVDFVNSLQLAQQQHEKTTTAPSPAAEAAESIDDLHDEDDDHDQAAAALREEEATSGGETEKTTVDVDDDDDGTAKDPAHPPTTTYNL